METKRKEINEKNASADDCRLEWARDRRCRGHQPVTIPASARGRNQKMEKQKPMRQKKIPGPGRRCYRRCSWKCLAVVTRDTWPTDWPRPSTAPYATSPTRLESRDQLQGFRLIFFQIKFNELWMIYDEFFDDFEWILAGRQFDECPEQAATLSRERTFPCRWTWRAPPNWSGWNFHSIQCVDDEWNAEENLKNAPEMSG